MKKTCKKYFRKLDKTIRSLDVSYRSSTQHIHFDDDDQNRTYIGALISIIVFSYVAFIGYVKAQ